MLAIFKKNVCLGFMGWIVLATLFAGGSTYVAAEILYTPEGVVVTHYPERFDLTGNIDRIDKDGIILHDRYFAFAPHVKFMTPKRPYATINAFKVGQEVSLVLNEQRQVIILCAVYQD